ISTGDGAHSVYLADYNNDGNFDIAVANPYSNNVSVILNNGNAEFGPQSTYGVGEVPYWITSADLNGDGYIDIATANNTTQDVSILLNNGDGTFGTSIEYSVGATTRGLTAADFDNDGDMDLVSANETVSFVSFLLNNGDGTFQSYRSWRTGISPLSVTAGDFDNDGDIDIVSANKDDYNTSVLFNDGTGIFTLSANYSIGNHVRCVTNADLNGDGFLDLITANADDDNISVLMNNSDGTFADRVNYAVGDRPITVFPCDIDGDGDQDLLTANDLSNDVSILLNNGNGTFASQTTVPSGSEPHAIFAGDLTNDGDLDFVVANWNGDNIMIYLNERRPRIAGSSPNQNDLNIIPSTEINLTLDTTMSSSTFSNSTLIVHASQTGLHSGTISYDEPTKTATFEPDEDFAPGEIVTVTLTDGIESTEGVPLKPYTWSFTIEAEEAPAEFEIIEEYATFNAPHDAVPVDYDNDGDMDIWVACLDDSEDNLSIYLNDGNGFFTPGSTYVVYDGTGSLAFADFNGDGFTDLVANKGKQVVLGYGNGDGTGYAGPVLSCWEGDPQSGVYQVITSDFNSDGHADIATCNATTTDISIILNNGDGTFEGAVQYPVANFPVSITYGDIDNDGDIDIAVANHFDDKITIHRNNGDGTFANYVEYITSQGPYSIKMADLNGDQYLDITCGHGSSVSTDTVTVMMNNGDGTFANYQTINVGNAPLKVNTGDMDGDGDIDIIVANADGTSIQILENDGIANFSPGTTYTTGSFPISPYPADLDNDGDLDIVTANRDSDNISILFNEICTDSDGDHFGDPGYPENTCATDNCPSVFNPDQEDYDLDGIGDSCDPCNNFMFELTKFDTLNVKVTEPVIFYPEVTDPDDTEFYLTYNIIPTWATIQNDTLYGTPPGDTIVYYDTVSFSIMDACNIDSLTFTTMAFLCGNINGDSRLNILDITYLIAYLYKNGDEPEPLVAADINDSGNINILDITYLIAYLYKSGPAPVCQE
ncbi:MAG: FG-GAP-like repeat-containing protein, partial [Candidatus Zixiibacteriota bacterium]